MSGEMKYARKSRNHVNMCEREISYQLRFPSANDFVHKCGPGLKGSVRLGVGSVSFFFSVFDTLKTTCPIIASLLRETYCEEGVSRQ